MINKEMAYRRSFLMRKIREFFDGRDFLEVETPIMTSTVDPEPNLTPFETTLKEPFGESSRSMYLVTSPEFQMKKLIGAGFPSIYTLTKVFRNGEVGGGRHNPEFTMLEWYRKDADYMDVMAETEELIKFLAGEIEKKGLGLDPARGGVWGATPLASFDRKSLNELFIEKCGIDLLQNRDFETFKKTAEEKGHSTGGCTTWDDILYKIFLNDIEPTLGFEKPVFVYDYPASQGALARKKESEPFWVERFELYIKGQELCNAFSELLDVSEQRVRFTDALKTREKMGKTVFGIDEEFLKSLESIRHPLAGNALGVDRLMMVLFGKEKIEEVILFSVEEMK